MAPDIRLVKEHQHEQKEECDEDQEEGEEVNQGK